MKKQEAVETLRKNADMIAKASRTLNMAIENGDYQFAEMFASMIVKYASSTESIAEQLSE